MSWSREIVICWKSRAVISVRQAFKNCESSDQETISAKKRFPIFGIAKAWKAGKTGVNLGLGS